ncbi:MAG: hypothetical protein JW952_02540 [Candidatus Eisenbacteria bacterium]|nr:hypothetical protein [Candidatus Eisenbacteria bacterium]
MSASFSSPRWYVPLLIGISVVVALAIWGCSEKDEGLLAPQSGQGVAALDASHPAIQSVMAVQDRYTTTLMADPEIIGTATTVAEDGRPAVMVLALTDKAAKAVPRELAGFPVVVHITDRIVALKTTAVSHKAKQTPPIKLGTSGGWRYDLANGYCCGGTLGSLIQVGSQKRILSNYHVLEADIVSGGNGIVAKTGDPVIQPGLIDVSCNANNAQNVASLVVTKSLPNSNVDCSSATVISGMVSEDGSILEVGTISSQTVAASVGQAVKKSGRTTGLTRSTVSGLNATVSVAYEDECAGDAAFTKTFTGQIIIKNRASKFLAGGDSGSLMLEDVSTNPRAVGLLFAGSTSLAVANPINEVLSFLNATMVGN